MVPRLSELHEELNRLHEDLRIQKIKKVRDRILQQIYDVVSEIKATSITELFGLDSKLIESQDKLIGRYQMLINSYETDLEEKTLLIKQYQSRGDFT